NLCALADMDALGAKHVALDIAFDIDRVREDVGSHLALGTDGDAIALELHGAADLAFDDEIFLASQVAVYLNRRPDHGGLARRGRPAGSGGGLVAGRLEALRLARHGL